MGTVYSCGDYGDIMPDTYAKGKLLDWLTPFDPLYVNDMGGNYSGPARIHRMELYFRDEAEAYNGSHVMDVDIVGFSRAISPTVLCLRRRMASSRISSATSPD